jgi:hypothetical protein
MTSARKLTLALALGCALLTPAAQAASKKELVAKVVQLQMAEVENMARALTNQVMQPRVQAIGQALNKVPAEKRDVMGKEIQADLRKTAGEIEANLREKATKLAPAILSAALEEKFNEDELRQIASWLESPTARKFNQYGSEAQNTLVQKLVAESRASVEPKLQAFDDKVKNRFTALAAAPASK